MDAQLEINPKVKQAVPFFAVGDINRSLDFYIDGLQFEITTNGWTRENSVGAGCNSVEQL